MSTHKPTLLTCRDQEYCRWGFTPPHEAVTRDNDGASDYAVAKMLLDAGARRGARDGAGRTAQDVANSERMKRQLATDRLGQGGSDEH